jgi:hypothetical protein
MRYREVRRKKASGGGLPAKRSTKTPKLKLLFLCFVRLRGSFLPKKKAPNQTKALWGLRIQNMIL